MGHLPGQPSPLAWCQSSPTSASRQRRDTATPPSSPCHHPACLPSPAPAQHLEESPRHLPDPLSLSLVPISSSVSLSRDCHDRPKTPTSTSVATCPPSPCRQVQKLRCVVLDLLAELRSTGRPEASPTLPFPTSGADDPLRRSAGPRAFPASPAAPEKSW